jgi:1,4-alpha-glucan branching enzyme
MPGDEWQRFANLRLLLGSMWAQPGKKLLFMGGELGQPTEWDHDAGIPWELREDPRHEGIVRWVRDLNALHRAEPALHALDTDPRGFEWLDASDAEGGTLCFLRRGNDRGPGVDAEDVIAVVLNLTPMPHERFRVGLPTAGAWREVLNSDAEVYGGSGTGNLGRVQADPIPWHDRSQSAEIVLPPLACLFFRPVTERREGSQAS